MKTRANHVIWKFPTELFQKYSRRVAARMSYWNYIWLTVAQNCLKKYENSVSSKCSIDRKAEMLPETLLSSAQECWVSFDAWPIKSFGKTKCVSCRADIENAKEVWRKNSPPEEICWMSFILSWITLLAMVWCWALGTCWPCITRWDALIGYERRWKQNIH